VQKALPVLVMGSGILELHLLPLRMDAEVRWKTILASATLFLVGYLANLLDPTFEAKARSGVVIAERLDQARKTESAG
jgi:hypothetical protein